MNPPSEELPEAEARAQAARGKRRSQIVQAAKEVIAERGYHNASINEIIKRAEIARGTFYLYFSNKHKVFDAILDEALQGLRDRIERIDIDEGAPPPQVQLRASLVRVFEFLLGDQPLTQILLSSAQTPDAEAAERVAGFYRDATDLISLSLQHGIEMGLVRELDSDLVASALLGAIRGVIADLLSHDEPPDAGNVVDELIVFAMRGVFR